MKKNSFFLLVTFSFIWISSCTPKTIVYSSDSDKNALSEKEQPPVEKSFDSFEYHVLENGEFIPKVLDKNPYPIDGESKFFTTMYRSIKYPNVARQSGVEGTCSVRVILNELGVLENATLVKSIGAGCGEEALKAVKKGFTLPMAPGILNEQAVKVQMDIPVRFRLH